MKSHIELSVQRDIDRIKGKICEMSRLAEQALRDCLSIFSDNNHQRAYAVILRDQNINAKEKEVDRLCLEFLVRQQPVAMPLRFAYSTIRINLEMERVGDYAESIARHLLMINDPIDNHLKEKVIELARISIEMFHNATEAFICQNQDLAKKTIVEEQTVDALRTELNKLIAGMHLSQRLSFDMLNILMAIVRRFERVSDQAGNICTEVLYMCTGEYAKHPGSEFFRVLFIDHHNSCVSQMAEVIAQDMKQYKFIFASAGIEPLPIDRSTIDFMKNKGYDVSRTAPKSINQIPNLDHYQIVIALDEEGRKAFPAFSTKVVFLEWSVVVPCHLKGTPDMQAKAFEEAFTHLKSQIQDLVQAITVTDNT
jgi:phosphate transport system protein